MYGHADSVFYVESEKYHVFLKDIGEMGIKCPKANI